MGSRVDELLDDDGRVDRRLDRLEREFDDIERSDRELLRKIDQSPIRRSSFQQDNSIDHVSLMSQLISRIQDPHAPSPPDSRLPIESVKKFVDAYGQSSLPFGPRATSEERDSPDFGDKLSIPSGKRSGLPPPRMQFEPLSDHPRLIDADILQHFPASSEPAPPVEKDMDDFKNRTANKSAMIARELEAIRRIEVEQERDLERESRKSSDLYAKDLLRTLRSLERQMVEEYKLSDASRRDLEVELERMRNNVGQLEMERQGLADKLARKTSQEKTFRNTISLLEEEVDDLQGMATQCKTDLRSAHHEIEILKDSVIELENSRSKLQHENGRLHHMIQSLRHHPEMVNASVDTFGPTIAHHVSPSPRPGTIHTPKRMPARVAPVAPGESSPQPFTAIAPQRMSPNILKLGERAMPVRQRATDASRSPPFALHYGIEALSPSVIEPQRMSVSDLSIAQQQLFRPHAELREERSKSPPTPTTPRPRDTVPAVDIDKIQAELLELNLERQELEAWLSKFPPNTAGRTLAERKEKYMREKRLRELEQSISEKRLAIKQAKIDKSHPMG